jgi:hypothetical protein
MVKIKKEEDLMKKIIIMDNLERMEIKVLFIKIMSVNKAMLFRWFHQI